jgi:hypothetical protein
VDTRQLEARLGRVPQFAKSADGLVYTIPIEPRKRDGLPLPLQSIKTTKLIVPQLYNLQPCRVEFQGVTGSEAENLQQAFKNRCAQNPSLSLIAHINYLSQNMHSMTASLDEPEKTPDTIAVVEEKQQVDSILPKHNTASVPQEETRSHIITIPRPPEWNTDVDGQSSDGDDLYDSSTDDDDSDVTEDDEPEQQAVASQVQQRGILISFPHLEMYGIELLEVFSVSIEVKCERCKTQMDMQNIKNNAKLDAAAVRSESCRKCANAISIGTMSNNFARTCHLLTDAI